MRDRLIRDFMPVGPGRFSIDVSFMDYAAACLLSNYRLSDPELEFVLSGERWQGAVLAHLCGGEEYASRVMALMSEFNPAYTVPIVGGDDDPYADPAKRPLRFLPPQVSESPRAAAGRLKRAMRAVARAVGVSHG
jgi:hypothetical protein